MSHIPPAALVLAAGRGERLRPHTDHTPKPLLEVAGKPLIEWHLLALARAGVKRVVINTAWLEDQFPARLGDGSRWGLELHYSKEQEDHGGALETAGGMAKALPWLSPQGHEPFWLVSADIHAPGFDFSNGAVAAFAASDDLAHLWLVPNPDFHPLGDFELDAHGRVRPLRGQAPGGTLTYANIALVRPALVDGIAPDQRAPLGPCLQRAAAQQRLSGERLHGAWHNVGTPEQWLALNPS